MFKKFQMTVLNIKIQFAICFHFFNKPGLQLLLYSNRKIIITAEKDFVEWHTRPCKLIDDIIKVYIV